MSCQIFVSNLMIFAQIHPKKLEGAPRFSQKKTYLHLDSTQFVGRDTLKQICPKSFPSLLSLFLLFGFIARFCFPKSPSCICYTLATDPQISIALFSLSPSNSVFLVLMLHSLLCLFNSLWIPSPGFHLGTITHSEPNLLYDSVLCGSTATEM